MSAAPAASARVAPDRMLADIADYVLDHTQFHGLAFETARLCLIDGLGCALQALDHPECTKLLGPLVPGTLVPHGARVPGTPYQLDPVSAAFDLGSMIGWLDFHDTWPAAGWCHPSDGIGAILMTANWLSRRAAANGRPAPHMRDVLNAMVQAHEIQGMLALGDSRHAGGVDRVALVKVASAALVSRLLGLDRDALLDALSLAWLDGPALRNGGRLGDAGAGRRWAAGDASSRGVRLALMVRAGEAGCATAPGVPARGRGDSDVEPAEFGPPRAWGSHVMENVLFKPAFAADLHAQTAVEAALALHARLGADGRGACDIERVTIHAPAACLRRLDRQGALHDATQRERCIQYMVAVALLHGRLTPADYADAVAADPRIDALRARIGCVEDARFGGDRDDAQARSMGSAVGVLLQDGSALHEVLVEQPLGHKLRRGDGIPLLEQKFRAGLARRCAPRQQQAIAHVSLDTARLAQMPVHEYVDLYCPQ